MAAATRLNQRSARRQYARMERERHEPRPGDSLAYRLPDEAVCPYAEMLAHLVSPDLLLNSTMIIEAEVRPGQEGP